MSLVMNLVRFYAIASLGFILATPQDGLMVSSLKRLKTSEDLKELKKSKSLILVYFNIKEKTSGDNKYTQFFAEYEKSAEHLHTFDVILAVFECSAESSESTCSASNVEDDVYTYMDNIELITLELDTMFDFNSIVSNSLQLALLHEVPILSSLDERFELEKDQAGQRDILFAYLQAIGSEENRIFIEMAFLHHDKFKFAVSTDYIAISGLEGADDIIKGKIDSSMAVWLLSCKESTLEDLVNHQGCYSVMYPGHITHTSLSVYIHQLSQQTLIHATSTNVAELLDRVVPVPTVYIYQDGPTEHKAASVLEFFTHNMRGMGRVVIVNMDDEDSREITFASHGERQLPALSLRKAVQGRSDGSEEMSPPMVFCDLDWSLGNLQHWVAGELFREEAESSQWGSDIREDEQERLVMDVETQDDEVVNAVFGANVPNTNYPSLPSLDRATFSSAVKSSSAKIVLFYLTFDAISMATLEEFDQAAKMLEKHMSQTGLLVRVDCFDATDVCSRENITTYPAMHIYRDGSLLQEYTGSAHHTDIASAVKLLQNKSPVHLTSASGVAHFIKGDDLGFFKTLVPTSVLLVVDEDQDNSEVIQTFTKVSQTLSTTSPFAIASKEFAQEKIKDDASMPSIFAWNRQDDLKPMRSMSSGLSKMSLENFVKSSNIEFVPELNTHNFPKVFKMSKMFTLLFIDPTHPESPKVKQQFTEVAMKANSKTNLFCWMKGDSNSLGHTILNEYTSTATLPMVVVVDYMEGNVFTNQDHVFPDLLSNWLDRVQSGEESPTKKLKHRTWGPPNRHYDFLKIMDSEKNAKENEDRYYKKFIADQTETNDDFEFEGEMDKSRESSVGSVEARHHDHSHTEL